MVKAGAYDDVCGVCGGRSAASGAVRERAVGRGRVEATPWLREGKEFDQGGPKGQGLPLVTVLLVTGACWRGCCRTCLYRVVVNVRGGSGPVYRGGGWKKLEAGEIRHGKCGTTKVCQIMHFIARSESSRCHFQRSWHAHSHCARALCSTATQHPRNESNHQGKPATNQRPLGNNGHHSRSMRVLVPQSRNVVPHFAALFQNWCQIFSAIDFGFPNSAHS